MARRNAAKNWGTDMCDSGSSYLGASSNPVKVAVIGSGPSGFYAAEALLQSRLAVEVDILERLPVPYGLVRFGVAPDHAKLKSVTAVFQGIAKDRRVRYFGNVELGRDVSIEQLLETYHAVVVATGAGADQRLNIDNEQLEGVHAARDFVGWYNGHPECVDFFFDLSQESVTIVGQGNVAIDVCRILAKPIDELRKTDIAEHALDALANSRVKEIHVVGRRGPVQAKFTPKELRELGSLPGWRAIVSPADLDLNGPCKAELDAPSAVNAKKNIEIMRAFATNPQSDERSIYLDFYQAPVALNGDYRLRSVTLERQRLEGEPSTQIARGTGERFVRPSGLLFRSVGYRGSPMAGIPFDERRGVIRNRDGRVVDDSAQRILGLYATGWIKRGPTGIIGTNRADSVDTVARLIEDLPMLDGPKSGRPALLEILDRSNHRFVSFEDWLAIERAELTRGTERQKAAEKFVSVDEMLAATRHPAVGPRACVATVKQQVL